jgi:hypothetical protein
MSNLVRACLAAALLLSFCADAGDLAPKKINRAVEMFGSSLGCNFHMPKQNIVPWKDKSGAGYLVLFSIDYGCSGGNAMDRPALAVVRIGAYSTPYVDQRLSTPDRTSGDFPAIIERITKAGNKIQYSGRRLKPSDALCCASQRVQGTVTLTAQGWEPKDEHASPQ